MEINLLSTFNDLNIDPTIMKAIQEMGFETPSPIQSQALPILLGEPTDFIGLAATGTGKTAAFSIPLLDRVNPKLKHVQVIVLCPTRELALQVTGQINLLGKHKGVKAIPIYGGASYGDQIYGLKTGAAIVVGTPGRIVDHIEKGTLKLDKITTVVLDEADEMISMGFKEELEKILESTSAETRNIWLFSATMSRGVRSVADQYLQDPKQVHVNKKDMLSTTVEQIYYTTQESNKPEVLCKIIDAAEDFYGIVFCQTKSLVTDLTQYLTSHGYKVDCLHGDKDQKAREKTMKEFREKKTQLLICTDVASRGIDVKDITHVINYSIPREFDNYIHRIGRTARSGKTGYAMSLVTPSNRALVARIEALTKTKMKEGKIPTRKEIGSKKVGIFLERFKAQDDFKKAKDVMSEEWNDTLKSMTAHEVASRFLSIIFPGVFVEGPKEKGIVMPGKPREEYDGYRRPTRREPARRPHRGQEARRPAGRFVSRDRP